MWWPMTPFMFFVTALAVWRVVVFVRQDGLIEGTRNKIFVKLAQRQKLWSDKLIYLIGCQWCLGIWFALVATFAWLPNIKFSVTSFVVTWLALAGTSSIIDLITDNL